MAFIARIFTTRLQPCRTWTTGLQVFSVGASCRLRTGRTICVSTRLGAAGLRVSAGSELGVPGDDARSPRGPLAGEILLAAGGTADHLAIAEDVAGPRLARLRELRELLLQLNGQRLQALGHMKDADEPDKGFYHDYLKELGFQIQDLRKEADDLSSSAASAATGAVSVASLQAVPSVLADPVSFPGPVCKLIAELKLARDGLLAMRRAPPDWSVLFRPSPLKCLIRVDVMPQLREALKTLVRALKYEDKSRLPLSCVVASPGTGKTDFFMELALIIQAIGDDDEQVIADLLEDPEFDPQTVSSLKGAVVMGITFNSGMMMDAKEDQIAAKGDCRYLHVLLRMLFAEVADMSRVRNPGQFLDFLDDCYEALGTSLSADGIEKEVKDMLRLRANRGDVESPLIVLADEVFLVSDNVSKVHYPNFPTAGDATRSYLCQMTSRTGGVVGMSSLLNDDMMRERRTTTRRPVYQMAALPEFNTKVVFSAYLDEMTEAGLYINTVGELLQWEVQQTDMAPAKGFRRRNALFTVMDSLVGSHARFTVAVARGLVEAMPGAFVWDVISEAAEEAVADKHLILWQSRGGTRVIARALLGHIVKSVDTAMRTPAGDVINFDDARRQGYVLASGGSSFSMVFPAVFLFKLVSRYDVPAAVRRAERQDRLRRVVDAESTNSEDRDSGDTDTDDEGGGFGSRDLGVHGGIIGEQHGGRNLELSTDGMSGSGSSEATMSGVGETSVSSMPTHDESEGLGEHELPSLLRSALQTLVDGKMLRSNKSLVFETVMCQCEAALHVCRAACGLEYADVTPQDLFSGWQPDVTTNVDVRSGPLFGGSGPAYVGSGRTLRKVPINAAVRPASSAVETRKLDVLLSWIGTKDEPLLYGRSWQLTPNQTALDSVTFFKAKRGGRPTVVGVQNKTHTQEEKDGKALGFNEVVTMVNKLPKAFVEWEVWKPHFVFLVAVRRRKSSRFDEFARKAPKAVHENLKNTIVLCQGDVYRYLGPTLRVFVEGLGLLYTSQMTNKSD